MRHDHYSVSKHEKALISFLERIKYPAEKKVIESSAKDPDIKRIIAEIPNITYRSAEDVLSRINRVH